MKLLFSVLAMAAILGTAPAAVCESGIAGRVILGPLCPVERPGMVCSRALAAVLRVQHTDGSFVTDVPSDSQGRFAVGVPAGAYTILPQPLRPKQNFPYGRSASVNVAANTFTWIDVYYDTGIR